MKIAYIILAYHLPHQLKRLVQSLDADFATFFIHIDKRKNINDFEPLFSDMPKNKVHFVKREISRHSSIGCIRASLNGMKDANASNEKFDFLFFLSGQDYPIKSNKYIYDFLNKNLGKIFIDSAPMPIDKWANQGMNRIEKYHFYIGERRFIFPSEQKNTTIKSKIANFLFRIYFHKKRKFPKYLKPYGGEYWFCISSEASRYIIDFVKKHKNYLRYHKYTFVPEEIFFQSILLNANNKNITDNIENNTLRFIDWSKPEPPYPAVLGVEDFENLCHSEMLFARKFDMTKDVEILDKIDKELRK